MGVGRGRWVVSARRTCGSSSTSTKPATVAGMRKYSTETTSRLNSTVTGPAPRIVSVGMSEGTSQLFFVLQGQATLTVVDAAEAHHVLVLEAGDTALLAESEYYKLGNTGEDNLVVYRVRSPYDGVALYDEGGRVVSEEQRARIESDYP